MDVNKMETEERGDKRNALPSPRKQAATTTVAPSSTAPDQTICSGSHPNNQGCSQHKSQLTCNHLALATHCTRSFINFVLPIPPFPPSHPTNPPLARLCYQYCGSLLLLVHLPSSSQVTASAILPSSHLSSPNPALHILLQLRIPYLTLWAQTSVSLFPLVRSRDNNTPSINKTQGPVHAK
ncbi:hypothetical protein LZ30DRAFT_269906 [Colletotrichum cereale]|nr:hypothetical protein LZ30DRAFT_269906 [Colletotrichum cereale]